MKPIKFSRSQFIAKAAVEIGLEIANLDNWTDFKGHGLLPGIKSAVYEKKTEEMVGSRIKVENTDGSGHVEEILKWEPGKAIQMKLCEFTPPLSRLASHFTEDWDFEVRENGTQVSRGFALYPTSAFSRPFLWLISRFFRQAIAKHLRQMAEQA